MKSIVLIIFFIGFYNISNAQIKNKTRPKVKKDVDILYQKYKNLDSVTINNASIQLTFSINKIVNEKGLPICIIMSCYTGSQHSDVYFSVKTILKQLMDAKEKSGYKFMEDATLPFYGNNWNILVAVYQKGTQYAKYGFKDNDYSFNYSQDDVINKANERIRMANELKGDFVYMEVGDMSRIDGQKLEKFTF